MHLRLDAAITATLISLLATPPHANADGKRAFLVALASRATLCDSGERCDSGVCASDGHTACTRDWQCPNCFILDNEDIAMCTPKSSEGPVSECDWSVFFDGNAAGLNASIRAMDVLRDGSLVLRTAADNSVPDLAGVNRKDLVRFIPRNNQGQSTALQLPYTEGAWELFWDGDAIEANSGGVLIEGLDVLSESCRDVNGDGKIQATECDILFSPVSAGTLGGISFEIEDIVRCRPTKISEGGAIEACNYGLFYDASTANIGTYPPPPGAVAWGSWNVGGTAAFAMADYDATTMTGDLYFTAGNVTTLPAHQPARDLLMSPGHPGPLGMCSGAPETWCMADGDCGPGSTCLLYITAWSTQPTSLAFDGSAVIPSENIAAIAIVEDGDADGIPDLVDNCVDVSNPAHCTTTGSSCESDSECAGGACLQPDADHDAVGDACDRCPGRNDAQCYCGDGVVDPPTEACDLGSPNSGGLNGIDGSGCSADCRAQGLCTRSGTACATSSDCADANLGEGCCGNGRIDRPAGAGPDVTIDEECDDGNRVGDDACGNVCRANSSAIPLPPECEGVIGPRLTPTFVRNLRFRKKRPKVADDRLPYHFSQWISRGEFSLAPGVAFDPDTQQVELILSQEKFVCNGGGDHGTSCQHAADCDSGECTSSLYRGILNPGDFTQSGLEYDRPRWNYRPIGTQPPLARGWAEARLTQRLATIHRPLNAVKYKIVGRGEQALPQISIGIDPLALGGPPTRIRQTIRVGGLCTTQTLVCEANKRATTLTCYSRFE